MKKKEIISILTFILGILVLHNFLLAESAFEFANVIPGRALIETASPLNLNGTPLTDNPALNQALEEISVATISQLVPRHRPELYLIEFDPAYSVESALERLRTCPIVKNAYPNPLVEQDVIEYFPDDMQYPAQWHLPNIEAPVAHGIFRGADTIQVAIIDGGVNYLHEDLAPNIWINPGEDLNGNRIIEPFEEDSLDNDGNGLIDDFWGWDWINVSPSQVWPGEDPGPPDNNPMDFDGHGTHCAGDACGASDNSLGIASPGFNCQIMTLRAGYLSSSGQGLVDLVAAIPAVYYAIDMGAEVISMSFGGPSPYSPFQNALLSANNAGLVTVAAAGNDDAPQIQYPAGYEFVIAVAATAPGDIKASFSNYGDWITLSAPGEAILSTVVEGYGNMGGTSMSTPIAAGAAAMVKALKPEWTPSDISQWLAFTADNIDAQNPQYIGQLGGGRINLGKAVDLYVTIDSFFVDEYTDWGTRLRYDDALPTYLYYHKYLGNHTNVTLLLTSSNPRVTIGPDSYFIGDISSGQTGEADFFIEVTRGEYEYEIVEFEARFTGDNFQFTQPLEIPCGYGQVLIIDADSLNEEQTAVYYEEALDSMGYSHEKWRKNEIGLTGNDMPFYDVVIVFSGTAEENIFSSAVWNEFQTYYSWGGKLIISGQNIAQDLSQTSPSLMMNFLKVDFLEEHSNILTIKGAPGNPVTQGMYMVMAGEGGAWNQYSMDVVEPLGNAETCFMYDTTALGEAAGIRITDGNSDMFFCAFGIEGVNDNIPDKTTRLEILQMMFDQFGVQGINPSRNPAPAPVELTLYPPYPNPFNHSLKIAFEMGTSAPVTIKIYDLLGREVDRHFIKALSAGYNEYIWNAPPGLSSGVYFVNLNSDGKNVIRKGIYLK